MILAELVKLYDRLSQDERYREALPRNGYSIQKISFEVVIDRDGNLKAINDLTTDKDPCSLIVCGGAHPSGSAATPRLLWDSDAYIFGYYHKGARKSDADQQKAREILFPAYRQYHLDFLTRHNLENTPLRAVCNFLQKWNPGAIDAGTKELLDKVCTNFGIFRVSGDAKPVYDDKAILSAWDKERMAADSANTIRGECLITGEHDVPLSRTVETKIKLPGTAVGGGAIASFNSKAFTSYGKDQTFNSPISVDAGFKSHNALNFLLGKENFKTRLGDTTAVFWTEKRSPVENCLAWLIGSDTPADESAVDATTLGHLKDYLEIIRKGAPVETIREELATRYFVLGIAPNAARIAIKFWHTETLGTLLKRLRKHHGALAIERPSEKTPSEIPLWKILLTTARESKDIPPLLPSALLRSVTEDQPYPIALYQLLLNRINVSCQDKNGKYKCGAKVSYVQAATIKAILIRNYKKGELTMSLNPDNHSTPYLLGRLFATLEKTQGDALGDVNAGIGDKYYSSASSTPSIVFPTLLNLFRKHLKKLAAEKPGLAHIRESLVQEIMDNLDSTIGFPANLALEDRGLFAIGYYQQMRDFYRKKDDKQTTEQN